MICDKCNKEFTGSKAGAHKRWCRGEEAKNNQAKVLKKKQCLHCNIIFEFMGYAHMTPSRNNRETNFCGGKCQVAHTMTNEVKVKISEGRKKYLLNYPEEHPWRNLDKFISKPCEHLKDRLRTCGIDFVEEYRPLNDCSYSIDIAFPNIKVGVEVNGNQHYMQDKKTLTEYYQKRHNEICNAGWNLIEIHYLQCYSDNIVEELKTYMRR